MITERTRCPLHTERIGDIEAWLEVGWTYCGEHPALPGFALLEWREFRPAVAPFKGAPISRETNRERNRLHGAYINNEGDAV